MKLTTNRLKKLKPVGKGGFTRCYQLTYSTVLLESHDPVKKIMAEGKFPKSKLFPEVQKVESPFKHGGDFYTMHYYEGRPKRSTKSWLRDNLKPKHYELYLELHSLYKNVEKNVSGKRGLNRQVIWNEAFATLSDDKIGKILIRANNACCAVAKSIGFECMPRNVAPHEGNLILLDCFWSSDLFFKIKKSQDYNWAIDWEKYKL